MTLMSSEIYDALREVGVSHDRALKVAEALVPDPPPTLADAVPPDLHTRLQRIEYALAVILVLSLWGVLLHLMR
jgi:hypothetical protein